MSFDLENPSQERALPSDITPREPLYRRKGAIATLVAVVAAFKANQRLRKASRRYLDGSSPQIPDYLREDLGLSPMPPKLPAWWEIKW